MTPTEKITAICAIKIQKSTTSELSQKISSQTNNLRELVLSQSDVWNEINDWMTEPPVVNNDEIDEYRNER